MSNLSEDQFGDYRMSHRPGDADYGAPMHNVDDMFPDYHQMPHVYRTYGDKRVDQESHRAMTTANGRPDADIPVYRAMPNVGGINPGDWVTPSKAYAEQHKESNGKPDWIVAEKTVKARHLFSEGNSIAEWGYHPDA